MSSRDLFGGAIHVNAPTDLIDASNLRQIPDTQEVFLYPDSSISIIVEILQSVEPSILEDAIKFHFDSLAHDNDATFSKIQDISTIANDRGDETPSATILWGEQYVTKFNCKEADHVRILMALYRIEEKSADLVVTFNAPVAPVDGDGIGEEGFELVKQDFETLVRSLQIVDFSLFA
ncbi:hypothetical protein AX15_005099 [Amanita polypyramis BW_CC]|nr:hypothetical protein AX15_005099 [Amanita polypyramis BW_CC]